VTENVADFSTERDVVPVFRDEGEPARGQAVALATALDRWAHGHPDPYHSAHWPHV
jgi:hypothetical protein